MHAVKFDRKPARSESVTMTVAIAVAMVLLAGGPATAQTAAQQEALRAATQRAKDIKAATGAPAAPQKKLPTGDPCTIVSMADVQKAFPGAKAGVRSTRLEQDFGATECSWKGADGQLVLNVQEAYNSGKSAKEDALGMASGFVEPFNAKAIKNVRIETFPSLGDEAAAFVEKTDAKRGILNDGAMLELRRGRHNIALMAPDLPNRDRAAA
nr:hypothetical protein [Pseudomonadota bacterium]